MTEQLPWQWDIDGTFAIGDSSGVQRVVALVSLNMTLLEAKPENKPPWPLWVCLTFPIFI